jgi:hypothetical protein
MAGYSGTPLAKKLGIKPDTAVLLVRAPKDFESTLDGLPTGVEFTRSTRAKGPFGVIVAFLSRSTEIEPTLEPLATMLASDGGLWIAWPKAHLRADASLTETLIRGIGLRIEAGALVDNKVCAISDEWSGLRFVRRLDRRHAAP